MNPEHNEVDFYRHALKESCIRLAYYVQRFGGIPEVDQRRLAVVATLGRGSDEFLRIKDLAGELREYFLQMPQIDGEGTNSAE